MSLKVALILVLCLQTSSQETFDTVKGGRVNFRLFTGSGDR